MPKWPPAAAQVLTTPLSDHVTHPRGSDHTVSVREMGDEKTPDDGGLPKCVLPKRPVPAFFLFCRDKRKDLPQMTLLEGTQRLSQIWKSASEEEKEVYISANMADKERYRNDMAALTMKYPDTVKALLAKRRMKKKTEVAASRKQQAKKGDAPKKRGRKRKIHSDSPRHSLSPSGQDSVPPTAVSVKPRPPMQDVKVPGTDIPIFTPEFLDYNKKLNAQLMQMRKTNKDLQSENSRLEDSINDQEKNLATLQDKLAEFRQESEMLERNLKKLEDAIFKSFGSLANGSTDHDLSSAEQLLNYLLTNGTSGKALAVAMKSFTIP